MKQLLIKKQITPELLYEHPFFLDEPHIYFYLACFWTRGTSYFSKFGTRLELSNKYATRQSHYCRMISRNLVAIP